MRYSHLILTFDYDSHRIVSSFHRDIPYDGILIPSSLHSSMCDVLHCPTGVSVPSLAYEEGGERIEVTLLGHPASICSNINSGERALSSHRAACARAVMRQRPADDAALNDALAAARAKHMSGPLRGVVVPPTFVVMSLEASGIPVSGAATMEIIAWRDASEMDQSDSTPEADESYCDVCLVKGQTASNPIILCDGQPCAVGRHMGCFLPSLALNQIADITHHCFVHSSPSPIHPLLADPVVPDPIAHRSPVRRAAAVALLESPDRESWNVQSPQGRAASSAPRMRGKGAGDAARRPIALMDSPEQELWNKQPSQSAQQDGGSGVQSADGGRIGVTDTEEMYELHRSSAPPDASTHELYMDLTCQGSQVSGGLIPRCLDVAPDPNHTPSRASYTIVSEDEEGEDDERGDDRSAYVAGDDANWQPHDDGDIDDDESSSAAPSMVSAAATLASSATAATRRNAKTISYLFPLKIAAESEREREKVTNTNYQPFYLKTKDFAAIQAIVYPKKPACRIGKKQSDIQGAKKSWDYILNCCHLGENRILGVLPTHPFHSFENMLKSRVEHCPNDSKARVYIEGFLNNRTKDPDDDAVGPHSLEKGTKRTRNIVLNGVRVCDTCFQCYTGMSKRTFYRYQKELKVQGGQVGSDYRKMTSGRRAGIVPQLMNAIRSMIKEGYAQSLPTTAGGQSNTSMSFPATTLKGFAAAIAGYMMTRSGQSMQDATQYLKAWDTISATSLTRAMQQLREDEQLTISLAKCIKFTICTLCSKFDHELRRCTSQEERIIIHQKKQEHMGQVILERKTFADLRNIAK